MMEAVALATALSKSSSLKSILCRSFSPAEQHDGPSTYLATVTSALRSAPNLEDLKISHDEEQGGADIVVRAISLTPQVKRLNLNLTSYTDALGEALAHHVETRSRLQEIDIVLSQQNSEETPPCACPLLLEAVTKSFTIQQVRLWSHSYSRYSKGAFWDSDMRSKMSTITLLNRAGRGYMGVDPNNQTVGFKVLDASKYYLDCVYVHLRENPGLCTRQLSAATATNHGDRKRKVDDDLTMT